MNCSPRLSDYCIEPGSLENFLRARSESCFESEILRHFHPQLNLVNGSAIELYRSHFVLFHQLYQLQSELWHKNEYLHVHFMAIHLLPLPEKGKCRQYCEGSFCLRETSRHDSGFCSRHSHHEDENAVEELSERFFYLDEANFNALREEDAEAFISGAWNLLLNHDDLCECYRILGMPMNSDMKLVRLHFRRLAKEMHPDINPDCGKEFSRINSAYRRLISYLSAFKL